MNFSFSAVTSSVPVAVTASGDNCDHTFVQCFLSKPVPTFCAYCHRIIWVFQGRVANCTKCDIFHHQECHAAIVANRARHAAALRDERRNQQQQPQQRPQHEEGHPHDLGDAAPASPTPYSPLNGFEDFDVVELASDASLQDGTTTGDGARGQVDAPVVAAHTHELAKHTFLRPTYCAVCGDLLLGVFRQGLQCAGCTFACHERCAAKAIADQKQLTPALTQKSVEPMHGAMRLLDTGNDEALSGVLQLLRLFNERNHRFAWGLINPVVMLAMHREHGAMYARVCDALRPAALSVAAVRETLRVLRYAIAAYGVAYHDGHFRSCFASVLMRVTSDAVAAKDEPNCAAVVGVLALPRSSLRLAHWGRAVFDPTYSVIVDDEAASVVLAFRGSLSDSDFLTDGTGQSVEFCGGHAHDGIARMVGVLFESPDHAGLLPALRAVLAEAPSYRLLVTGHSLGAGLACLFVVRAIHEGTFAPHVPHAFAYAPPPTLTLPEAGKYDAHVTSVIAGKDVVCRLQFNSIDRLGFEIASRSTQGTAASGGDGGEHADLTEEAHIVGRCLLLTRPDNHRTRLVDVNRTNVLLHQIFLSRFMVSNHLMDNYSSGLRAALRDLEASESQRTGETAVAPAAPAPVNPAEPS